MQHDSSVADPAVVLDLIEAFRRSKTMFAAVSLGLFDSLAAGAQSAEVMAQKFQLHPGALAQLLDGCVGLGLLTKDGTQYKNTPVAATFLCRSSARQLTGYIQYSNQFLWKLWANLEDAIRQGTNRWRQTFQWDGPIFDNFFKSEDAKNEFLMGMHGFGMLSSPKVVVAFDLSRFRRLVDLGGATGHLAVAACQRYPGLRAVVFDLPGAVPLAREMIAASPVADHVDVAEGDFFVDRLPEGDLFALGRILHDWDEEKIHRLLQRIYDRLPGGGALLIAERLLADDKTGPMGAVMQSLNMLVCTEGKERTAKEYERLLVQAGFTKVQSHLTGAPLDAVLATK